MKKLYLLILVFITSNVLTAQPVITGAIAPEIGDTWDITFMEISDFDPGLGGGVAQTWDFSDLDISNSLDLQIQVLDPAAIVDGPVYPDADFVWYLQGFEIYNYYSVKADSISLVGGASIQNGMIDFQTDFIDPEDGIHLPIMHGENYTYYSLFEQTVLGISLGTNDRNGIVAADGFGTVITPNGTFNNVLRLVITETSFGFTNTQYAWFDVNNFVPVFLYETSDDPDTPASLYFSTPNMTSPTIEIGTQTITWNARYSKADQGIVLDLTSIEESNPISIQVYTMDGMLITSDIANSGARQVISLPPSIGSTTLVITLKSSTAYSSQKIPVVR